MEKVEEFEAFYNMIQIYLYVSHATDIYITIIMKCNSNLGQFFQHKLYMHLMLNFQHYTL